MLMKSQRAEIHNKETKRYEDRQDNWASETEKLSTLTKRLPKGIKPEICS